MVPAKNMRAVLLSTKCLRRGSYHQPNSQFLSCLLPSSDPSLDKISTSLHRSTSTVLVVGSFNIICWGNVTAEQPVEGSHVTDATGARLSRYEVKGRSQQACIDQLGQYLPWPILSVIRQVISPLVLCQSVFGGWGYASIIICSYQAWCRPWHDHVWSFVMVASASVELNLLALSTLCIYISVDSSLSNQSDSSTLITLLHQILLDLKLLGTVVNNQSGGAQRARIELMDYLYRLSNYPYMFNSSFIG